jgi:SAM-dependent methyltransferase
MRERRASHDEILAAFDELSDIYAHVPPLIMWRAWELAAYRHFQLRGPVLDLGCGDGRFFRRAWGDALDVVGVDAEAGVVDAVGKTGLYREVLHASADSLPFDDASFASVFANCSVEHMDELDSVLAEVARVLAPGGIFLLSVISDKFVEWAPLRALLSACGEVDGGDRAQRIHEQYHHLVNALPLDAWVARLAAANLRVSEWAPLMQGAAGASFLLLDQLWHMPQDPGEFGDGFAAKLQALPNLAQGTRQIFQGLLALSPDDADYAGLVLCAHKA